MSDLTTARKGVPAEDGPAPEGMRTDNLLALIARIEKSIEAETASIRSNPAFDMAAANTRKGRHLYELGRAFKSIRQQEVSAEHRAAMIRLRESVATNEATIKAHLSAVSEVASLLQDAIERAQADGTYSVREFGQG